MKEVIILEVSGNKSQLIQDFLKSKKVDYRILVENQLELNGNSKKKESQKELSDNGKELEQAYRECYANPRMLKEAKLWEQAGIETWLNYERGLYRDWKKPTEKVSKSISKKASGTKWQ